MLVPQEASQTWPETCSYLRGAALTPDERGSLGVGGHAPAELLRLDALVAPAPVPMKCSRPVATSGSGTHALESAAPQAARAPLWRSSSARRLLLVGWGARRLRQSGGFLAWPLPRL